MVHSDVCLIIYFRSLFLLPTDAKSVRKWRSTDNKQSDEDSVFNFRRIAS